MIGEDLFIEHESKFNSSALSLAGRRESMLYKCHHEFIHPVPTHGGTLGFQDLQGLVCQQCIRDTRWGC